MDLESFEYEEQEQYTNDDVQAILSDFKSLAVQTIANQKEELQGATVDVERLQELETSNHNLQVQNLAVKNNISDDLLDLIVDSDLEVVQQKIDKLKSITKEKEIDNSFKPATNRSEDAYTKAENDKDVKGMLSQKINKLFG